ncbi:MAG: hypothetical protein LN412_07070 [Candidatus Thermoplasmatota archaeon]|nr:hypothetical protein [Candidatus Thermoplasmatota archaeon]
MAMHTDTETRWGLKLVSWALLIYVGAIVFGAFRLLILWRMSPMSPLDFQEFWLYAFAFSLIPGVLSATYAIIFLIGFSTMYRHRGEAGLVRERSMRSSLFLLIAAVVALVTTRAVSMFLPFLLLPSVSGLDEYLARSATVFLILGGVGIVVALLLALLLYLIVVSLVPSRLLSRLKLAAALFVLSAVVAFGFALASTRIAFPFPEFESFVTVSLRAFGLLLFWSVYRTTQGLHGLASKLRETSPD